MEENELHLRHLIFYFRKKNCTKSKDKTRFIVVVPELKVLSVSETIGSEMENFI